MSAEQIRRIYSDHFVILLENAAEGRLNALLSSIENEEITLYFSAGIYSVTDSTESINLADLIRAGRPPAQSRVC